jgi:trans-L-3-hydroxyproline dehydratase
MASIPITHPFEQDLGFLYGTIFTGEASHPEHHSRNVCIFADGEVDRSPTGTGVSARAALHHARGELRLGETITIESIVGSTMTVTVAETTTYGPYPAVIPEVGGCAWFIGRTEFWIDPDDPFRHGFFLR